MVVMFCAPLLIAGTSKLMVIRTGEGKSNVIVTVNTKRTDIFAFFHNAFVETNPCRLPPATIARVRCYKWWLPLFFLNVRSSIDSHEHLQLVLSCTKNGCFFPNMQLLPITRAAFLGTLALAPQLLPFQRLPNFQALDEVPSEKAAQTIDGSKILRERVREQLARDTSLAGPLLRLAFHDATTFESSNGFQSGGSNGSIRFELEKMENRGLIRPLHVVEAIHDEINKTYGISLAGAIALAGAVAVEQAGGPFIPIRLGRSDVSRSDPTYLRKTQRRETERSVVAETMPNPGLDADGLRLYFGRLGLSESEFVALSGAHSLGRHVSLLGMSPSCLKNLTQKCLEEAPTLLPFVSSSVDRFDNSYFPALMKWNSRSVFIGEVAFIPTDVALVVDKGLYRHVVRFADDQSLYFRTFRRAYQKLVENTATSVLRY